VEACLFAAAGERAADGRPWARVLDALVALYAPLGAAPGRALLHEHAGGCAGWVALSDAADAALRASWEAAGVVWWGEAPPPGLREAEAVLAASDAALRALPGFGLLLACRGGATRLVTGPGGPVALYRAGDAFATHAVACDRLARAAPAFEPRAVVDLAALGYVGGDATLLRGVAAVAPAARIDLRPAVRPDVASYWPAAERWAPVPEPEAHAAAESALRRTLRARLHGVGAPRLGLTAGLDSMVVAIALTDLGIPAGAFTWDHDPRDLAGARAAAARLGIAHDACPVAFTPAAERLAQLRTDVLWTEGMGVTAGLARPTWPAPMAAFVTGGGGEAGRAWLYRLQAGNHRRPSIAQLAGQFRPDREIAAADPEARAALSARVRAWLEAAAGSGLTGWRLLDVLFVEQRLARWGRGTLGRHAAPAVPAFLHPEVTAALVSAPLAERVADGFHRRLIARRLPGHPVAPPPTLQRRAVPPPLRRAAAALRARRPRPAAHAGGWAAPAPGDPYAEWLADAVLRAPLVTDALGERWAAATRDGLRRGDPAAAEGALRVSAAVALQEALR
jgi:hypothetical protein